MRHYYFLVVLFLGFTQCKKSENVANQNTSVRNSIQYAEGFSIAIGQSVPLLNVAQSLYATGYIVVNIPVAVSANFTNATQEFSAYGLSIAVSESQLLTNAKQTLQSSGFSIPVGQAASFLSGVQLFDGAGFSISVSDVVPLVNHSQVFYGTGTAGTIITIYNIMLYDDDREILLFNDDSDILIIG